MTDTTTEISGLTVATSAAATDDLILNVDAGSSAYTTKRITFANLRTSLLASSAVTSLAGTANEITASASTGAVTLSLPSAITFTGKTITGGTFSSPTLTTPALGTPASGIVTNLTGTASININGTVGATTPTTGAFTTLSTTGAITYGGVTLSNSVTGTGSMVLSAAPSLTGTTTLNGVATALALVMNSTNANGFYFQGNNSGTAIVYGGAAKQINGAWSASDFAIGAVGAFRYDAAGSHTWSISGIDRAQVTSTGINGTAIGATTPSSGAFTTLTASTSVATPIATVGTQQTTQGSLVLANTAAGAFSTTLKSSNSASAAWTMTLPTTAGTSGYVLQTDGAGVTSWTSVATQTTGNFSTLPTVSSTGGGNSTTYTTQTAKTVKTGKAVIDNVALLINTASGGSGSIEIANALSNAPLSDVSCAIGYYPNNGLSSGYVWVTMLVLAGTTTGLLYGYNPGAGTYGRITNGNFAVAGNGISYSAAYQIA